MSELRWTDEQVAAITHTGDALLAASAGTGKTTTIVGKILWLLGLDVGVQASTGRPVPPNPDPCCLEEIAAITFTEKAAFDLKRSLRRKIEESERGAELRWELDRASVGTIHGFCAQLLRDHALRLGIDPTFRVLDERETQLRQDELIRDAVLAALGEEDPPTVDLVQWFGLYRQNRRKGTIDHVRAALRDIRWRSARYRPWTLDRASESDPAGIDTARLRGLSAAAGLPAGSPEEEAWDARGLDDAAALYRLAFSSLRRWLEWLEEENVRDYDSLILDARRLLTRPETRSALDSIRRRYRILIIDEFQDTDAAQRDIAFAVAGLEESPRPSARPQLFLVGDPKQSIYRFRGADITVWNEVRARLCGEQEPLELTHNFRSEPAVVELVNRICARAMSETASAIGPESPESRVEYRPLVPGRPPTAAGGMDWIAVDGVGKRAELREEEARAVASHIRRLVGRAMVVEPEDGSRRACRYRDIAILGRKREALAALEPSLRAHGIPFYNTVTGGLAGRQEVLDVVSLLRLIDNPLDDRHAFAYLRSPFVGLRDEVLARIRLDPATGTATLQRQAERFLSSCEAGELEWFEAPESPLVSQTERTALETGLGALREAQALADRAYAAELVEEVMQKTGYRLHLLLRDGAAESLANLERFLALLEDYRHLPLGSFLQLWDRWGEQDLGIPQAPLFSKDDDVVTLSTVHTAKGLEWPIVILADAGAQIADKGLLTNTFWSDLLLGPVLMRKQGERGPRAEKLLERAQLEDRAEEARLLYVAATRARDRFVVSAPTRDPRGYGEWLAVGLEDAKEEHQVAGAVSGSLAPASFGAAAEPQGRGPRATAADAVTGTGRQIDAFGMDEDPEDAHGQFNLFGAHGRPLDRSPDRGPGGPVGSGTEAGSAIVIFRKPLPVQATLAEAPVSLGWLAEVVPRDLPELARPLDLPVSRRLFSATERMMRARDPEGWSLRYEHGVQRPWEFAPDPERAGEIPATLRGTLIHGVLERIQDAAELSRVLNETIEGIDAPDLESLLAPGSDYRAELEREIESVVRGEEWRWYVDGDHARELRFVHLLGPEEWCQGAFDLYRPAREGVPDVAADPRDADTWIIDFKTHRIAAGEVARVADEYAIQVRVYREAAEALTGAAGAERPAVRVRLHFTGPNRAVEV